MKSKWSEIVKVKQEYKLSILLGKQNEEGEWRFKKQEIEKQQKEKETINIGEQGKKRSHQLKSRQSGIVNDWNEASQLLKDFPWGGEPKAVHPLFRFKIWNLITACGDSVNNIKWQQLCFPDGPELAILATWIKSSDYTVVITGSTISQLDQTEARRILSIDLFNAERDYFEKYYRDRIHELSKDKSTSSHSVLSMWENNDTVKSVITQSTDGYHRLAGNKNVYELHGSLRKVHCHSCGEIASPNVFLESKPCTACGGRLRPSITLIGETLPKDTWKRAAFELKRADLVLIIGTSLKMSPSNKLPSYTNGKLVVLNETKEDLPHEHDLYISGNISNNLLSLHEILFS